MHLSVGLTMRKICGELQCPEYYLCEKHDLQCYPCQSYCNQTSHNYDANMCEQQCQDYIHDYIKHYVKASEIQGSLQEVENLKFFMILVVLLIVVAFVLISMMIALIWNHKRCVCTFENEGNISYLNRKLAFSKLRDNVVSTVSEAVDDPTMMMDAQTSVSTSNKFPCEDITLEAHDFTGYDNPGMSKMSPVFCTKL